MLDKRLRREASRVSIDRKLVGLAGCDRTQNLGGRGPCNSSGKTDRVNGPQRFDNDETARILRRASRLDEPDSRPTTALGAEDLVAVGREAGLSEVAVRRAIALERIGDAPSRRTMDRILGAATVSSVVEVVGAPVEAVRLVDRWLVDGHHLRRMSVTPDSGEWSRRSDPVGSIKRAARKLSGDGDLGAVRLVQVRAVELTDRTTLVRVDVDRSGARLGFAAGGGAVGLAGCLGVGVISLLVTPLALAAAPVVLASAVAVASTGRRQHQRLTRSTERLTRSISNGEQPRSLSDGLRRRIGR
jgi:hypothetical protein